ncbi:MAG: phosphocholine cytidylyltransferase family protein [Clostridia bacterium]|nr:phosphocholine cytidylyltransferase family protein [Clostridia bacterium]
MLDRYSFEVLALAERSGLPRRAWRESAEALCLSGSRYTSVRDDLLARGLLCDTGDALAVTPAGLEALEPYRARRAVIFAAGFGSRMVPVTLTTPKPLVTVHGIRMIDRLLDAFLAVGITDITIVRGYLKDKFDVLKDKYPAIRFADNDKYETENNISSALAALDSIDRTYICAGDLLLTDPAVIRKYHYCSNYLASYSLETDDWCFDWEGGYAANYRKGGTRCYNQYEITYWDAEDCRKLRRDWQEAYRAEGGHDLFWEYIPLVTHKDNYRVEIRPCPKGAVMEIDNYAELQEVDAAYL